MELTKKVQRTQRHFYERKPDSRVDGSGRRFREVYGTTIIGVRKGGKVVVLEGEDVTGKSAVVTSALPLTAIEQKVIEGDILKKAGAKDVSFEVDPGIMGGLTIQIDDKLFDHSVSSQLAGFKSRLN